jgi:hypothetical protein
MLWDLSTDYYLHHADPRLGRKRRSYTQWWTPSHLAPRTLPRITSFPAELSQKPYDYFDDYWLEYYRPKAVSPLEKVFAYNLNSTIHCIPLKQTKDGRYDLSPFVVRTTLSTESPSRSKPKKKTKPRKGIIEFPGFKETAEITESDRRQRLRSTTGWLRPSNTATNTTHAFLPPANQARNDCPDRIDRGHQSHAAAALGIPDESFIPGRTLGAPAGDKEHGASGGEGVKSGDQREGEEGVRALHEPSSQTSVGGEQ